MKTVFEGKFLRLIHDRHWEYVQRLNARGAAVMVAITEARELVLVEQTRIPLQGKSIELPAGIVGDTAEFADESFEQAALRELLEETGFRGRQARVLCKGPTAPGLSSEQLTFVGVSGLVREHPGGGVDGEDITVHLVPLAEVAAQLARWQAQGYHVEPRIYAGLYFALHGGL